MQVDLIFKIAAIGILVAVLNQLLTRAGRDEQATMVVLAGLIMVMMIILREINELFEMIKDLFGFY
jgi:stage III sporulation protein AC